MYGSLLFVFIRAIVAIFVSILDSTSSICLSDRHPRIGEQYMGTQLYYAGRLMNVALLAIFGSSWQNFDNHLPSSAGITSPQLMAFFIVFLIQGQQT